MKTLGSGVGWPFCGSRACRWMMEAPASAAAMDCSAISFGVIGRYSDMEGVWMAPVTAQVMMTLVMAFPLFGFCLILPRAGPERKGVIRA